MEFDGQKPYSVLAKADIRSRMEKEVEGLGETLLVSKSVATVLLSRHGWNINRVYDSWVFDDDRFLLDSGLKPVSGPSSVADCSESNSKCGICFEPYPENSGVLISTPFCSHRFCRTCWGEYVKTYIDSNCGDCSRLSCPTHDCHAAVGPETIDLLSKTDKIKYHRCLVRSYVEQKSEIKGCPAPECEYVVELRNDESFDVVCLCSHMFCWNCLLESHRPVTCNNASDWFRMGTDEKQSLNWIVAYTKPCPNCYRPIEKDYSVPGCDMMTCAAPCKFVFCWNCLKPWVDHRSIDFCDEVVNPVGMTVEAYERRELAVSSCHKYSYCCDNWEVNSQAMKKAASDLRNVDNIQMDKICRNYDVDLKDLGFLREAWMLIAQCRQVLKWSYVYGYLLSEYDNAKKEYLTHLQYAALSTLQKYSENLEKEMIRAINGQTENFFCLRKEVTKRTQTTGNYFHYFVKTLEEGLQEVRATSYGDVAGAYWFCDRCTFQNTWLHKECQACCEDLAVLHGTFHFAYEGK